MGTKLTSAMQMPMGRAFWEKGQRVENLCGRNTLARSSGECQKAGRAAGTTKEEEVIGARRWRVEGGHVT